MDSFADQLNIDTPELVAIEFPVAGIGSRFIAILVDYLLWTIGVVILFFLGVMALSWVSAVNRLSASWAIGLSLLAIFLVHWGYFSLFEAFWNGRTPGKWAAKIRVIHRSGRAISFMESLGRNLLRAVDTLPAFYAVGVISIFVSRQHQRLGDMVAGTLVVRDREIDAPHWGESGSRTITAAAMTPTEPFAAPHLSVSLPMVALGKLGSSDLEVLEGFFARRLDMDLETRAVLAQRLADAMRAKGGFEFPAGISVETFLEAIAHQLRESTRLR